jgi:hypothetical protein
MHVVGHQNISQTPHPCRNTRRRQQFQIKRIVIIREKDACSAIAPLGDKVWKSRDHNTRKSGDAVG